MEKTVILLATIGTSSFSVLASYRTFIEKVPPAESRLAKLSSPSKLCPHTNTLELWSHTRVLNCLISSIASVLPGEASGDYITS